MPIRADRIATIALLCLALGILDPLGAGAVTFRVTTIAPAGGDLDALSIGDEITLGIRIEDSVDVFGLGASAFGYATDVMQFVRGEAAGAINIALCIPAVLGCVGGMPNYAGSPQPGDPWANRSLFESSIGAHGSRVQFAHAAGLLATNSSPRDPGLGPVYNLPQDHARLTFRIVGMGSTIIHIGTGYEGDGEVLRGGVLVTTADTPIEITVVPEPGTALLFVLGMAALAALRARWVDSRPG
jgi:hypothetical protein